jgi:hypothetical protein
VNKLTALFRQTTCDSGARHSATVCALRVAVCPLGRGFELGERLLFLWAAALCWQRARERSMRRLIHVLILPYLPSEKVSRNASTRRGSNCVPASLRNSATAPACDRGEL